MFKCNSKQEEKTMRDFYNKWLSKTVVDYELLRNCKCIQHLTEFMSLREVNRLKQVNKYFYQMIISKKIAQKSLYFSASILRLYDESDLPIDSLREHFIKMLRLSRRSPQNLIVGKMFGNNINFSCFEIEFLFQFNDEEKRRVIFLVDEVDCSKMEREEVRNLMKKYDFSIFFVGSENTVPREDFVNEPTSHAWISNEHDFSSLVGSVGHNVQSLFFEAVNLQEYLKMDDEEMIESLMKDYRQFKRIIHLARNVEYWYSYEMPDFLNLMIRMNWYHLPIEKRIKLIENFFLYLTSTRKEGLKNRQKQLFRIQEKRLYFNRNGDRNIEACFFLVNESQRECARIACIIPNTLQMFCIYEKRETMKRIDYDEQGCDLL